MNKEEKLIEYSDLLKILEESDSENHLLLGNGFNSSLGILTTYDNIFEEMKQIYPPYRKVQSNLKQKDYDIEFLISKLKALVKNNIFLPEYIENKIKFDFMKATYTIVSRSVKDIYQEKNQEIHLLLRNFTNYFTLNYDPFLYLLLMKFKDDSENRAIAFRKTALFIKNDLDKQEEEIYTLIKQARKSGHLKIDNKSKVMHTGLDRTSKSQFKSAVELSFKDKGWSNEKINRVINFILDEEKEDSSRTLNSDDGFRKESNQRYLFKPNDSFQNIFFLHGSFHIHEGQRIAEKITQEQNSAFINRLEDIISTSPNKILCVLTGDTTDKERQIKDSHYLNTCFDKLRTLEGRLVILGSSLDSNDQHLFREINESNITHIYISASTQELNSKKRRAKKLFPRKDITYFNRDSISYTNNNDAI